MRPRYDIVALGEVMLRLDPGEGRIRNARAFRVWEGGGEYNVARGLRRCFGLRAAVVTALVDNDDWTAGRGLHAARWRRHQPRALATVRRHRPRASRNGLNFTERGFGVRGAVGVSDRGHTAAAALRPGEVDWHRSSQSKARAGSTPAASSPHSPTRHPAWSRRRSRPRGGRHDVSYDLNYRPSLWKALGGFEAAGPSTATSFATSMC